MASLASDWLRHFRLLLWNHWTEFNKTWQEARSQCPLPSLCFFGPISKTRWLPWPLIGWDIFDFSSETAERNSAKLDRKQDLKVLCQVCVFRADWKIKKATATNQMYSNDLEACGMKCCYFLFHSKVNFFMRSLFSGEWQCSFGPLVWDCCSEFIRVIFFWRLSHHYNSYKRNDSRGLYFHLFLREKVYYSIWSTCLDILPSENPGHCVHLFCYGRSGYCLCNSTLECGIYQIYIFARYTFVT